MYSHMDEMEIFQYLKAVRITYYFTLTLEVIAFIYSLPYLNEYSNLILLFIMSQRLLVAIGVEYYKLKSGEKTSKIRLFAGCILMITIILLALKLFLNNQ